PDAMRWRKAFMACKSTGEVAGLLEDLKALAATRGDLPLGTPLASELTAAE
ncbi:MAG: hypothetical protein IID14_09920, partial [Candidatus Marinimicrobia bacterium]|nr:hypothetical protein [Candidatus Neomarinimicrobiota bacterium]